MKRIFLFSFILMLGFANAQTLENKKITLSKNGAAEKMSDFPNNYVVDQDEQNYYVFFRSIYWDTKALTRNESIKYFIVNKDLTTIKTATLSFDKGDTYRSVHYTENQIGVICDNYDKKNKEMNIILKRYNKKTGAFIGNKTLAKVKTPSWNPWYYASSSPDGTKYGVVFMAENTGDKFDEFHAFVMNQEGEFIWKVTKSLQLSNETFGLQEIATTNDGKIYLSFTSAPKNKRSPDQMTYVDLTRVSEDENDHISIPLNKRTLSDVGNKALRNGNLFFACLFSEDAESHPTHLQTVIVDAEKFEITNNTISEIPKMDTRSKAVAPIIGTIPSKYDYGMIIKGIEELENGEIAIVSEQVASIIFDNAGSRMPFYMKGAIMTAFANKDGAIENYDVYNRFQKSNQQRYLSCGIFSMGNHVYYLFNESTKRYQKKGDDATFNGNNSKEAVLVCNKLSNGNKTEEICLTDKTGKIEKCYRRILLQEGNKLLIATGNSKTIDLEVVSLE